MCLYTMLIDHTSKTMHMLIQEADCACSTYAKTTCMFVFVFLYLQHTSTGMLVVYLHDYVASDHGVSSLSLLMVAIKGSLTPKGEEL